MAKYYERNEKFIKFKEECSKTGTTEEAIAVGEKLALKLTYLQLIRRSSKKVPVYFANFVLMDYGFGAVFGCPAHDQEILILQKNIILKLKL